MCAADSGGSSNDLYFGHVTLVSLLCRSVHISFARQAQSFSGNFGSTVKMEIEQSVSLPLPLQVLTTFIDKQVESLAAENSELQDLALRAAKYVFDLGEF